MGTAHVGPPCRVIPLVLLLIPVLLQRLTHRPLWVIILHRNGIVFAGGKCGERAKGKNGRHSPVPPSRVDSEINFLMVYYNEKLH